MPLLQTSRLCLIPPVCLAAVDYITDRQKTDEAQNNFLLHKHKLIIVLCKHAKYYKTWQLSGGWYVDRVKIQTQQFNNTSVNT